MGTVASFANTPNVGQGTLQNSDGTSASAAIFTAGASGSVVDRIVIHSGPTTAPGGTQNVVILHDTTIIGVFAITNAVDTEQYDANFGDLVMAASDTIKLQARTALAAGATLHCSVYGRDF